MNMLLKKNVGDGDEEGWEECGLEEPEKSKFEYKFAEDAETKQPIRYKRRVDSKKDNKKKDVFTDKIVLEFCYDERIDHPSPYHRESDDAIDRELAPLQYIIPMGYGAEQYLILQKNASLETDESSDLHISTESAILHAKRNNVENEKIDSVFVLESDETPILETQAICAIGIITQAYLRDLIRGEEVFYIYNKHVKHEVKPREKRDLSLPVPILSSRFASIGLERRIVLEKHELQCNILK